MDKVKAPQTVRPLDDGSFGIVSGNGTVIVSGTLTEVAEFMGGQPIRVEE